MNVRERCPDCLIDLEVIPDEHQGQRIIMRCPNCGKIFGSSVGHTEDLFAEEKDALAALVAYETPERGPARKVPDTHIWMDYDYIDPLLKQDREGVRLRKALYIALRPGLLVVFIIFTMLSLFFF